MNTAYATAAESQVYLAAYSDWLALTDAAQDTHLEWGRVYIDSKYYCVYDEDTATDNMKQANSMLAYLAFTDVLYADAPTVKSFSVSAGSVSSRKTYGTAYVEENAMHKQALMLMDEDCSATAGYLNKA